MDNEKNVSLIIRINSKEKNILAEYFKNHKGLSLSAGIRTVLYDYMNENGLITPEGK